MTRAFILVIDSFGCGGARDAVAFGDEGADTFGHIARACAEGRADVAGLRKGRLKLPTLERLGLALAGEASTGRFPLGLERPQDVSGLWGFAREISPGKDTPSGHWEIAGAPADFAWGYFPDDEPAFPSDLTDALIAEGHLPGILGDRHAPGIAIIDELGPEHMATGKPIIYTSVDSVLQIAAHEESFGLERLYALCVTARRLCDPLKIGRVIARPFIGDAKSGFKRTSHRRDYAIPAAQGNILDRLAEAGRAMISIGKIGDIFGHRATGREIKGAGDMDLFDRTLAEVPGLPDGGMLFANYVDLDTDFGHRRNVAGYAAGLEKLDARFAELLPLLKQGDLLVITADHGNDPTWRGTDHTRENVPVLAFRPGLPGGPIGGRDTMSDIGASVAKHLGLAPPVAGKSFL